MQQIKKLELNNCLLFIFIFASLAEENGIMKCMLYKLKQ